MSANILVATIFVDATMSCATIILLTWQCHQLNTTTLVNIIVQYHISVRMHWHRLINRNTTISFIFIKNFKSCGPQYKDSSPTRIVHFYNLISNSDHKLIHLNFAITTVRLCSNNRYRIMPNSRQTIVNKTLAITNAKNKDNTNKYKLYISTNYILFFYYLYHLHNCQSQLYKQSRKSHSRIAKFRFIHLWSASLIQLTNTTQYHIGRQHTIIATCINTTTDI